MLDNLHILFQVVITLYTISFLIQFVYWSLFYSRVFFHKATVSSHRKFPVSVIICARNEQENLLANLPLVLEQDYPDFEVIVVDDRSVDGTAGLLENMKKKYPRLRTTCIKKDHNFTRGKKLALTIGIKAAANEWLVLTDADCMPASNKWLYMMQRNCIKENEIVLGYGGYIRKKGLLNLIIRYETCFIGMQYLGLAIAGFPYMGVGRNLVYKKSLFFKNKGFARHYHIDTGDDDIFINEVAHSKNTAVEIRMDSHTRSLAETSWRDWYFQKKRHLRSGPFYRKRTKFLLSAEILSRLIFYVCFGILIARPGLLWYILTPFIFRLFLNGTIFKLTMKRLNERYLLLPSPLLDVFIPMINILVFFSNFVSSKRSRWI